MNQQTKITLIELHQIVQQFVIEVFELVCCHEQTLLDCCGAISRWQLNFKIQDEDFQKNWKFKTHFRKETNLNCLMDVRIEHDWSWMAKKARANHAVVIQGAFYIRDEISNHPRNFQNGHEIFKISWWRGLNNAPNSHWWLNWSWLNSRWSNHCCGLKKSDRERSASSGKFWRNRKWREIGKICAANFVELKSQIPSIKHVHNSLPSMFNIGIHAGSRRSHQFRNFRNFVGFFKIFKGFWNFRASVKCSLLVLSHGCCRISFLFSPARRRVGILLSFQFEWSAIHGQQRLLRSHTRPHSLAVLSSTQGVGGARRTQMAAAATATSPANSSHTNRHRR